MQPTAMLHAIGCNAPRNRLRWVMKPIAFLHQASGDFRQKVVLKSVNAYLDQEQIEKSEFCESSLIPLIKQDIHPAKFTEF